MLEQFARTQMLLGPQAMETLSASHVAVFGLGGVGGSAAEALARSGVGNLDIIDKDVVSISNVNRQVIATLSTVGKAKVDVMAARIADINPECEVRAFRCFYLPETAGQFDFERYDYVIDALDTVTAKLQLIAQAHAAGTPIVSSMGAANKLDPAAFEIADIAKTSVCPLAKIIRKECRKRGIDHFKVAYSREAPIPPRSDVEAEEPDPGRRSVPASAPFVPPVVGYLMAAEVVKDLVGR